MRYIAIALLAASLTGCAGPQAKPVDLGPFPAAEYKALPRSGTAKVTGQVFMRTRGGDVKYGAGSDVALIPATSYTEQLWNAYQADRPIAEPDSRARQYSRHVQADGSGYFTFTGVPAGRYYIASNVVWEAPTQFGLSRQGGFILTPVTVLEGQETRAMVTK